MASSTPETEWDAEQRGWMLALAVYRAGLCPLCGGPLDECGPKSKGMWTAPPPRRCYRVDAVALAQEGRKDARAHALLWRTEKRKKKPGRG